MGLEIAFQLRQGFLSLILWCVVVVFFYCVGPDEIFVKKLLLCTKHDVHVLLHVHVITRD